MTSIHLLKVAKLGRLQEGEGLRESHSLLQEVSLYAEGTVMVSYRSLLSSSFSHDLLQLSCGLVIVSSYVVPWQVHV